MDLENETFSIKANEKKTFEGKSNLRVHSKANFKWYGKSNNILDYENDKFLKFRPLGRFD